MNDRWTAVAGRIVDALGAAEGETVSLRDRTGRYDVLAAVALALERRGATPLFELLPPGYLGGLLAGTPLRLLAGWDRRRGIWQAQADRTLVLAQAVFDPAAAPAPAMAAWREAVGRLEDGERRRGVPYLLVAIPHRAQARLLGLSLRRLEEVVVPALLTDPALLEAQADLIVAALRGARALTIESGPGLLLHLELGDRQPLVDTGVMPPPEAVPAGVQRVNNLPAGAVYTTVVEESVEGSLRVPALGAARDATLRFVGGRLVAIEAAEGEAALAATLDAHSGEPRRVSHVGLGLNPHLERDVGWALVDEHRRGTLLLALGENRYLGGHNASSLNLDMALPAATLRVGRRVV